MDDCLIQIPKCHMNTETVAISRCISLVLVLNHRLMQLVTCQRINPDEYPSLLHYRHAASARLTYHKTLLRHWKIFSRLPEQNQENIPQPILSTPSCQPRRQMRSDMVDGVIPKAVTFASDLSTKTPQRHGALIQSNKASAEVQDMVHRCTGRIMQVYPCKANYKCDLCRKNTSWYCVGCKQWFCMTRRASP